mgnify:CR=1 FL=1
MLGLAQICSTCKDIKPHKVEDTHVVCKQCGKRKRYGTNSKSK